MADDDMHGPLSPAERLKLEEQQQLTRAFNEKQRLVDERTAQVLAERGGEIKQLVKAFGAEQDAIDLAAVNIARQIAERNLIIRTLDTHRVVEDLQSFQIQDAVFKANAEAEAKFKKEVSEAELGKQAGKVSAPNEPSAAAQQLKWNLGPGAVEVKLGSRPLEVHLVEQPEWVPTRPNLARQALNKAFKAAAIEVCGPTIIPPRKGGDLDPRPPPSGAEPPPDKPPTPAAAALAKPPGPNVEVIGKKSELNSDNERLDRDAKLAITSLDPATRAAARVGSSPTGPDREPDLMALFSPAEINRRIAEEREKRANNPGSARARGGRGR